MYFIVDLITSWHDDYMHILLSTQYVYLFVYF